MKTVLTLIVCLLIAPKLASAQQHTINFDGPPVQPPGTQFAIAQYTESGFIFKPYIPPYGLTRNGGGTSFYPEDGTAYLQALMGDSLQFYPLDGSTFGLVSVDLAEYSTVFTSPTVTFNGIKADGTTVSKTFTLD